MRATLLVLLTALTVACGIGRRSEGPREAPNVLLVSIDTLRADRLGCYGREPSFTPAIDAFSEEAVQEHLESLRMRRTGATSTSTLGPEGRTPETLSPRESALRNWPVQLRLVSAEAPFFDGAELLVVADCVPFAYPDLHGGLLAGRTVVVGCPKFDDARGYAQKLGEIPGMSGGLWAPASSS